MNDPSETPPSKGMMMIAAYRAARLSQRTVFRSNLHQSHVARRTARAHAPGRAEPAETSSIEPPPVLTVDPTAPESQDTSSVFANLVSISVAEQRNEVVVAEPQPEPEPDPQPEALAEPVPDTQTQDIPDSPAAPEVEAVAPIAYDPPLAEIGFGPGMLIRLSQLGLHTTGELAQADAGELRAALGEISRLVDVEAWISSAQQRAATSAA